MSVDEEKKTIRVKRKLEGYQEIVESILPTMITVEREINTPRYPTVPGRFNADDAVIRIWGNDVLKLNSQEIGLTGSPTQVRRIFAPVREKGEIVIGEGIQQSNAVNMVFNKLVEKSFLELK